MSKHFAVIVVSLLSLVVRAQESKSFFQQLSDYTALVSDLAGETKLSAAQKLSKQVEVCKAAAQLGSVLEAARNDQTAAALAFATDDYHREMDRAHGPQSNASYQDRVLLAKAYGRDWQRMVRDEIKALELDVKRARARADEAFGNANYLEQYRGLPFAQKRALGNFKDMKTACVAFKQPGRRDAAIHAAQWTMRPAYRTNVSTDAEPPSGH